MIKFTSRNYCLLFWLTIAPFHFAAAKINRLDAATLTNSDAASGNKEQTAVAETTRIVAEIIEESYPELQNARSSVKTFHSSTDYFRSRFSFARFLTFRKPHYIIFVNPQVFEKKAPSNGIHAVIAHELAHAAYYNRHNRFELFGLIGLESKSFTARFERATDLQAIKRGYGADLIEYREWLYRNISAKKIAAKKRDYFSPAEIDLILQALKEKHALIDFWLKNVPRNLTETRSVINGETSNY